MLDNVLITGGTGSLGNALTRTLLAGPTRRVCIISRDEWKQSEMRRAFGDDSRLRWFLGDVRDRDRLALAMRGVDTVIHAAALKQVPALEYSPSEAVMTNVMGAMNVVSAALERGALSVLGISTDKASEPTTLYGSTKLTMEKLLTAANAYSWPGGPRFSCVRYGNVAGSRGSVIPVWRELAAQGRPLPITDLRMTRFHIRMQQAVELVTRSLGRMRGGEVFIPRLPSFEVTELARALSPDSEWDVVGIRPGEKLHETLIGRNEAHMARDLGEDYALLPAGDTRGAALPDGFEYASNTSEHWLGAEELRRELEILDGAEMVAA